MQIEEDVILILFYKSYFLFTYIHFYRVLRYSTIITCPRVAKLI